MPDIFYILPVNAPVSDVFNAVATPQGLDAWWTKKSSGIPAAGNSYELFFSREYDWRAVVTNVSANELFELRFTVADSDWTGTVLCFSVTPSAGGTQLEFSHTGWPENNEHFRISSFCWAMYLRLLNRWVEYGEKVEYEERLNV